MKVEMMKGLPASGKSTLAREKVRSDGNSGRINRDDLRAMLFDSVWTGKRESVIVDCEKAIANVLLRNKMNPIIDDTNLGQSHRDMWSNFAKEREQHFQVLAVDTDAETCISRDEKRAKPVGRPVIERLAAQYEITVWSDKPIVIVDIDGTLADGTHRQHLVSGEVKDWKAYFILCGDDAPIDIVFRWVAALSEDHTICLVSGRPDTYWPDTKRWFEELADAGYPLRYDHIFMRGGHDKRPDTEVKLDILKLLPRDKIAFAIDDRPRVIRMWREQGIRVFPVQGECEDF